MNIRHRITLLVALTFAALSSIGGFAILQSRSSAAEVRLVTDGIVPSALASADLVSHLKDAQLAAINLVSAQDGGSVAHAKEALVNLKAQLQEGLDLQIRQADGETQRGLATQAREGLDNYFAAIGETEKFRSDGQNALAEANLAGNVFVYERELLEILTTLRSEKNRAKNRATEALNRNLSQTAATITAITALAVILLAVGGVFLYRQIALPISRMQAVMTEIASSQDFTRKIPLGRGDEIGRSILAFNTMIDRIHESSLLLRQKTADTQAMLQNLPQGILTITHGNQVHPEYSASLERILETQDIAGRGVMALIFSGTNLGADTRSQVDAAVSTCIGEDAMNFEFNKHLLAGEIEKKMPDGRVKILQLSWSPIQDDDGNIDRLLLCMHDVTELRELAAEANEKKHELAIIGEILALSPEKFHAFVDHSTRLIEENERLIRRHTQQSAPVIDHLFRNLHTVKGNARTYGFRQLTNVVHEAEQTCDDLRKHHPDAAWNQDALLEELAAVKSALARYAGINEVSLGRRGAGQGHTDQYLLVDRKQIQETLHRLETVNTSNIHDLLAARDAVRKVLRLLGTEKISQTLSGVFGSLPSLAMELGKTPPILEIEDNGYVVSHQISDMLRNVFMHLLRNAMDHGLETPEERRALGKPLAGTIRLAMDAAAGRMRIRLRDDGRGLALAHIRSAAVERRLLNADDPIRDEDVARQIFRPGFSTAREVTEVSGRGVGMDAVANFVKREDGRVEICFLDQETGAAFRRFEIVVNLPESLFMQVESKDFHPDGRLVAASGDTNRAAENSEFRVAA